MPQTTLAQQIELVQAQILRLQHAELGDRKTFRWTVQGGIMRDRLVGDDDTARMDTEVVGHAQQFLAIPHHGARHTVQLTAPHIGARLSP